NAHAERASNLDRHAAHAARATMHEERATVTERVRRDIRPCGAGGFHKATRRDEVESLRHRQHQVRRDSDRLRITPAAHESTHPVTRAELSDPVTAFGHDACYL